MLRGLSDYQAELELEEALRGRVQTIAEEVRPHLHTAPEPRPHADWVARDDPEHYRSLVPDEVGARGAPISGSELVARTEFVRETNGAYLSQLEDLSRRFGRLGDPYLLQVVQLIDPVLRQCFLTGSDAPTTSVLARLTPGQRAIVEAALSAGLVTLGAIEVWLIGLRRCLVAGDAATVRWGRAHFSRRVTRWSGETDLTLARLGQRGLIRFVQETRETRNQLAHGPARVGGEAYERLCDSAYGAASFSQWWQHGTDPRVHRPRNVGWIGLILTARKL